LFDHTLFAIPGQSAAFPEDSLPEKSRERFWPLETHASLAQSMSIRRILESVGLRPTFPRVLVLEFFRQHAHDHLGAEQVYKRLNEDMRNISLGSVYRTLSQLVDAQLLCGVALGHGRMTYELNAGNRHDHLVCTSCGSIHEFFDAEIEARQRVIADNLGFELSNRPLVLFGLCVECRKRNGHKRAIED
jgi:Fur family ferric uptake transcriptional regulator